MHIQIRLILRWSEFNQTKDDETGIKDRFMNALQRPAGTLLFFALLISLFFLSCDNMAEGGVRVGSNMEKYALDYIEEHSLLEKDEKILAYYDYTISLSGTEAAILTDRRVIYHNEETATTSMPLSNIEEIKHREESLTGDTIEIYGKDGQVMMIEIAPLNNGKTFLEVLTRKVGKSGKLI